MHGWMHSSFGGGWTANHIPTVLSFKHISSPRVFSLLKRRMKPVLEMAQGGFSLHKVKRQIGEVNGGERGVFRLW